MALLGGVLWLAQLDRLRLSLNPGSPPGFGARASGLLCLSAVLLYAVRLSCRRQRSAPAACTP